MSTSRPRPPMSPCSTLATCSGWRSWCTWAGPYAYAGRSPTMLTRLSVRQKLSLLLTLPLTAVVLVVVPFAVERVDGSRAADAAIRTVGLAGQITTLAQEVQRERLLALAYGGSMAVDQSELLLQQRVVDDLATRALSTVDDHDVRAALARIDVLASRRAAVLDRTAVPEQVFVLYHEVVEALLDALHLPSRADRHID